MGSLLYRFPCRNIPTPQSDQQYQHRRPESRRDDGVTWSRRSQHTSAGRAGLRLLNQADNVRRYGVTAAALADGNSMNAAISVRCRRHIPEHASAQQFQDDFREMFDKKSV